MAVGEAFQRRHGVFYTRHRPPQAPGAVEDIVGVASKHIVEVWLGHKPGEGVPMRSVATTNSPYVVANITNRKQFLVSIFVGYVMRVFKPCIQQLQDIA